MSDKDRNGLPPNYTREAGYLLYHGVAVCAGVVCKCDEPNRTFCPMHGRATPTNIAQGKLGLQNPKADPEE